MNAGPNLFKQVGRGKKGGTQKQGELTGVRGKRKRVKLTGQKRRGSRGRLQSKKDPKTGKSFRSV